MFHRLVKQTDLITADSTLLIGSLTLDKIRGAHMSCDQRTESILLTWLKTELYAWMQKPIRFT